MVAALDAGVELASGQRGTPAAPSPAFQAALQHCLQLSAEERLMLLSALGTRAALQAWCDEDVAPIGSAPPPPRPSRQVPLCWTATGADDPPRGGAPADAVAGCPWCRRPVLILGQQPEACQGAGQLAPAPWVAAGGHKDRCAYVTLLYGPMCHTYFLGALVLGWGLQMYGGASPERVLLHTSDVPVRYVSALGLAGWTCKQVEYLSGVAGCLFHSWRRSRFVDVFTKLRALQLSTFDRVLLLDLDLLIRAPDPMPMAMDVPGAPGPASQLGLESIFELRPPAAMKRSNPVPNHGDLVTYAEIWGHPTRRRTDELPLHQQASGINAGVMLLQPDDAVFAQVEAEIRDWYHPEHYGTYMPEQEYLGRLFGTFDQWTHVSCRFNFEVDKNERIPHDFTEAHEAIRAGGATGHAGAAVLHYSGIGVKPWDLLFERKSDITSLRVHSAAEVRLLQERLVEDGPGGYLESYGDQARLWAAMLEWLGQLADVASALAVSGADVLSLLREETDAAAASREDSSPGGRT